MTLYLVYEFIAPVRLLPFLSDTIHINILSLIMLWFVTKVITYRPGLFYNPFLYYLIIVILLWADFVIACVFYDSIFGCSSGAVNYSYTYLFLVFWMLVVGIINLLCALTLTKDEKVPEDVRISQLSRASSDELAAIKLKELLGTE